MLAIEKIHCRVTKIANRKDPKVKPGQPERFTAAALAGDAIRQGDLYLVIEDTIPAGYTLASKPSVQLVPGNTVGAKHCLDSLSGVQIYLPPQWTEDSLEGPLVKLSQERTVLHPTHGSVTIPAGMSVRCHYQREWDRVQNAERRARD